MTPSIETWDLGKPETTSTARDDGLGTLRELFASRGMAARVGLGQRPALLVIDLQLGFTDPAFALGAVTDDVIAAAARLVDTAHAASVPVIYTKCVWSQLPMSGLRNCHRSASCCTVRAGSRSTRGYRLWTMTASLKSFASAFFGTDLDHYLKAAGVDTLLLTGVTTSGCVRASAVDGCSYGYRVIVAAEAVGDRAVEPHRMSLFDLDAKYADILSCAEIESYLTVIAARRSDAR